MFFSRIRVVLLVLGLVFVVGCRQDSSTPMLPTPIAATEVVPLPATPTAVAGSETPGAPAPRNTPTSEPASETAVPPPPTATEETLRTAVMPFGPFHLPTDLFGDPHYTGSFQALTPETALETLEAARKSGVSLVIHLTGSRRTHQTATGAFSLDLFAQGLAAFQHIDLESYVADGTVVGHLMFDEPHDPSNWGGAPVPYKDIDAAAAASKALWPSLPVGVGGPPSYLAGGAPWANLDFAFAQYLTKHGDVHDWLARETENAADSGLGLALSINILGGNNRSYVTAEQLVEWGSLLASAPQSCALLMWKYDTAYIDDPAIQAALLEVADVARRKTAVPCLP